jgi:hypothetical protein
VSGKDTRRLVKAARKAGAIAVLSSSGHWRVTNPATGQTVTMAASPSCRHALANQKRDLRSIGLPV